ncbi:hypothetical protein DESC_100003 [Desulfosarcina cetonica]|nr:hypothetical protein DESC_100003 [Desulfosarcina cetonica]
MVVTPFYYIQSKYKFKGVFHGEKKPDQIHFKKEARSKKCRGRIDYGQEGARQKKGTQQAETRCC